MFTQYQTVDILKIEENKRLSAYDIHTAAFA